MDIKRLLCCLFIVTAVSNAHAKCSSVSSSDGVSARTQYTWCDNAPSYVGLDPQAVVKHAPIARSARPGDFDIRIEAGGDVFDAAISPGWGGRAGYLVAISDSANALRLAQAIDAGESVSIVVNKGGENYPVFAGIFATRFPEGFVPTGPPENSLANVGESVAAAVPARPERVAVEPVQAATVQAETVQADTEPQSGYAVSDLPAELTSIELLPFPPEKESIWRENYLNNIHSNVIDKACESSAFSFRRSHAYWEQVESQLPMINHRAPQTLDVQSASALCANEAAANDYAGQLLHHTKNAFLRLCALLKAPAEFQGSNLLLVRSGKFATACYDYAVIATEAKSQCMRSYLANIPAEQRDSFCECVGDEVSNSYQSSAQQYSSKTLVQFGSMAQRTCRSAMQ